MEALLVQRLMRPDAEINSESLLFFRAEGAAYYDSYASAYAAEKGASLSFDTYFNGFALDQFDVPLGTKLRITVVGTGRAIVYVHLAQLSRSDETLLTRKVDLSLGEPVSLEVPIPDITGLLYLKFEVLTDVEIKEIDYELCAPVKQEATIVAVITTFKRNDAVQATARRLGAYFKQNPDLENKFRLLIVDNGGETDSVPIEGARVIKNPNYGGAGGFSRGLLEVVDRNLGTHCLFMDDDASFFPEAMRRTLAVLSLSENEKLAVGGAMITTNERWRLWENAAVFRGGCRPIDNGLDLRDRSDVLHLAQAPQQPLPNKYAGWWYFCFPVAQVRTWPFPFFVRGDDVNFCLANDFHIRTLLGVVSHQEDFFAKQTPLTVYLDMRSHFMHYLTINHLRQGVWSDIKLFYSFFRRFNVNYHYESARSVLLAIEDIMKGGSFWVDSLDMSAKREEISRYSKNEKLSHDIHYDPSTLFLDRQSPKKLGPMMSMLRDLTLNGHLLPRFALYTKGRVLELSDRGRASETFLRPFILRYDFNMRKGYVVRRNRKEFFLNLFKFFRVAWKYMIYHRRLKEEYAAIYPALAAKEFWLQQTSKGIQGKGGDHLADLGG